MFSLVTGADRAKSNLGGSDDSRPNNRITPRWPPPDEKGRHNLRTLSSEGLDGLFFLLLILSREISASRA